MSWRATLTAVAFLSLSAISGCASRGNGSEQAEPGLPETTVQVDNRHRANVNAYLLRGGVRQHLGKVPAMNRDTFQVPHTFMVGDFVDIRVVADAVGGRAYVSRQVRVWPGDEIKLYVSDRLPASWITVRTP